MAPISIIIFCVFILQTTLGQVTTYTCHINDFYFLPDNVNTCTLKHLSLAIKEKNFQLVPNHDVTEIKGFNFFNSTVEVLTSDACDTLPFLSHFRVTDASLTIIDENAFEKCTKLETVKLNENYLKTLKSGVFASNPDLAIVDLTNNRLFELSDDLFKNNHNLAKVKLGYNRLDSLPSDLFKNNAKLTELSVNDNRLTELSFLDGMPVSVHLMFFNPKNNKLTDVDVEKIHEKIPKLTTINLRGNEFACDRQRELERQFEEKSVMAVYIEDCDWN